MEIVNKLVLITIVIVYNFSAFSQYSDIIVSEKILYYEELLINESDSLHEIRISSIITDNNKVYVEQTLSVLYHNDSLLGSNYERNPNLGREFTIEMSDSCKNYWFYMNVSG
jgi:hypothetical protein